MTPVIPPVILTDSAAVHPLTAVDPSAVSQALQMGGLALFAGGKDPFKAGVLFALTDLIDLMTHSHYSHSAIAMPCPSGLLTDAFIYESSINGKISGPQKSSLAWTLANYQREGGHAWILPFLPQFEPAWNLVDACAQQMIAEREAGRMPYDVKRLFATAESMSWVFDVITAPEAAVIEYMGTHSKGIVCSEMAGLLCQAGQVDEKLKAAGIPWLPSVKPPGQPIGCSPADLAAVPMCMVPVMLV